jgi:hypothetical protein
MQRTELSQFREGENQKFDQTQRDASSKSGHIDFATRPYQLHDQQQREGKGIMRQEAKARPQREEIEQVIEERGGMTSESAEVRLGFDTKLRGGMKPIDFTTAEEDIDYNNADDDDSSKWTNKQRRAVRLRNRAKELIDAGRSRDYIRNDIRGYRDHLRQELPSDDERAGTSHQYDQDDPISPRGDKGSHPRDYLTAQEEQDYDDAPSTPERRTFVQNNAVKLYNRAREYIDAGYSRRQIARLVQVKRQEYNG